MTDRKEDDVALLKQELTELSQACARLKNHPALAQASNLASLGIDHADLMMNYANQLDHLFKAISRHAETLRRMAGRDADAQLLSETVQRTIADLDRTISPVITSLRRHAWSLGAGHSESGHSEMGRIGAGAAGDSEKDDEDGQGRGFGLRPGEKLH